MENTVKSCVVSPVLEAVLTFAYTDNSTKKVVVREGQLLKDLVFTEGLETKTITGIVKVINYTSKAVTTGKDNCIHDDESVFGRYLTVNSLLVDYSDQYICRVANIPVKNIKGIGSAEEIPAAVAVNGVVYESLGAVVENMKSGDTITLLEDTTDKGVVVDKKDVTFDLGNNTCTFLEGVGSPGTQTLGMQLLAGSNVVIKNGKIAVPEADKDKFAMLIQNYANLTLENVTLDGTWLDRRIDKDGLSYVLSNNCGEVNIIGNTNIIANNDGEKAFAFDVCKYANYEPPVVKINTTGFIQGNIEVTEGLDDHLIITGGTFTVDVSKWVPEGYEMVANEDGTFTVKAA